jgi:uncharacterized protein YcaQ
MAISLDDLRRFTVAHSLFTPTTLKRALDRMGFVQADPIRAPAHAQDLILRHRVKDYRAGDLERRYEKLGIQEDYFINYGFLTNSVQRLMHPRVDISVPAGNAQPWPAKESKRARLLLDFVRERGSVHPREADEHFAHGRVKNYWGGSSSATTQLLDAMHYRGWLRVARREAGIRVYAVHDHGAHGTGPPDEIARREGIDALVDVLIGIYTPFPARSLASTVNGLRFAVPQWKQEVKGALQRAKQRLPHATVDGVEWYWPAGADPARDRRDAARHDVVRLLAPFDPVARDRERFELLWGWVYRFEAYTPVSKRKMGYYAMPLLWRDQVIGWGNLSVTDGRLESDFGYVGSQPPNDRAFKRELEAELDRVRAFLGLKY